MDEKYLQDLYEWIKRKDASYEGRYSYQDFVNKMQDQDYATKMHDWISKKDNTFAQRHPIGEFIGMVKTPVQEPVVEKKSPVISSGTSQQGQIQEPSTTELPSEGTSLATSERNNITVPTLPKYQDLPQGQGKPFEFNIPQQQKPVAQPQKTPTALKKSIDVITPDLISGTEEKAVPLMQYNFGDLGFKFEESGATGDWMTVTAPDGTKTEFSLDNWTSDKDKSESERLKNFIMNKSKPEDIQKFELKSIKQGAKISSDEEAKQRIKSINDEFDSILKEKKNIEGEFELSNNLINYLDSIPENERDAAWTEKYNYAVKDRNDQLNRAMKLDERRSQFSQRESQIQSSIGDYYAMKGEQGSWYGFLWDEVVDAFGKAGAGLQQLKLEVARKIPYMDDLIVATNYGDKSKSIDYRKDFIEEAKKMNIQIPEGVDKSMTQFNDWKNSIAFGDVRREEIDKKIFNNLLKSTKEGVNDTVINGYRSVNDPNTTVEYNDLSKQNFWGGAIAGLISFSPAMVGGPINRAANMFAISNQNVQEELNKNPELKDMSEDDKFLYALPLNLANSVLLEFGLNKAMSNTNLTANLVTSALSKAGAKATATEIKRIMKGEVESMIARGTINLAKGVVSGAELGTALYSTDVAVRKAINEIKGKQILETPKSATEFIRNAAQSAASLAAGVGIMQVIPSVSAAYKKRGYQGMSNDMFSIFEIASKNNEAQSALVADLKNRMTAGEITSEQAKEILNNYRNSVGLFKSMPEGLDINAKKQAMDLLKEKRDLENKIKDKDPALVKPQQDRINKINEQLTKLSEDAIQKQAADEALLRAGEQKLGLQKVGEGDTKSQLTPEQSQAVADEDAYYQEKLDNPYDEQDVEDAKRYFENPIAYLEEKVKFWEDEVKADPKDETSINILNQAKSALEAHKAAEAKPETMKGAKAIGGEGTETKTEESDVYYKDGRLKGDYIKQQLSNALKNMSFRKFADLYRKHFDKKFTREDNLKSNGGKIDASFTFRDLANYIISDGYFDYQDSEAKFRAFAKDAGIDIPEPTETKTAEPITIKAGEGVGVAEGEPTAVTEAKVEETKTALQQATEARKAAKAALESIKQGLGIDPTAKTRALVDYHRALVKEAKEFVKEKAGDLKDWAKSIGETVNVAIQKAWDEATNIIKPVENAEDLGYKYEDIFGADIKENKEYEPTMDQVDFMVPKSKEYVEKDLKKARERYRANKSEENKKKLDKAKADYDEYKTDVEKAKASAMAFLEGTDMYKNADPTQQNELAREVAKRFGERQPSAPSAEKITGQPKPEQVTMSGKELLKEQVKAFARGAKAGAQGVKESISQIIDYVKTTNIGRKDLKKVMDILKSKIETEQDLNKAIEKVFDIVDKSNEDIIEISKKKVDKEKMKAEVNGIKKGKGSVVDRIKQLYDYFDSVKEYGNLTRKDLSKIIKVIRDAARNEKIDEAVDKINKIIDNAKTDVVEMSEVRILKDKLREIRATKKNINEKRKLITAAIDFIKKSGKINSKTAGSLIKKLGRVDLENDAKIEKIIEYAEKVFEDAEYDKKLQEANKLRKFISKLSANKTKDANFRELADRFKRIKPSMVDSIDAYIDMASKIYESLKGSKVTSDKENIIDKADMVKISEAQEYIKEAMDAQYDKIFEEMIQDIKELMGVDASQKTREEILKLWEEAQPEKEKIDETIIRDAVKKMFDEFASTIRHILQYGEDPYTGDLIDVSESRAETVKKFMGMDLSLLTPKQSLEAMDSLANFIQNGSIANMESVLAKYEGNKNAIDFAKKDIKSYKLKFYKSGALGEWVGSQLTTLPILIEKIFKSERNGALFERMSGITDLKNQKTYTQMVFNKIVNEYVDKFKKYEPNGKSFNDNSNIIERAVIAAVKRTIEGTDAQKKSEFDRVKGLIEKSIEELKVGDKKEQEYAKYYQEVYDKILKDSESAEDVIKKSDSKNVEGVNFWIEKFADIYDDLYDVSESIYNKILDRDINFTPFKFSKLSERKEAETADERESMYHGKSGGVYKKKTGILEETNRTWDLPKNNKNEASRYLDLSFDKNMANAMFDALMDINTAATVRKIESFFDSKGMRKIIQSSEDRNILYNGEGTGRVQDFIKASRNKNMIDDMQSAKLLSKFNSLTGIGAATALGSIWQPIKQIIPVAGNTVVNTQNFDVITNYLKDALTDGPKKKFLDKIGYGISIRGLESQVNLKSLSKLVDIGKESNPQKLIQLSEKASKFYLDTFLKSPDVYIARASWLAYYEKALRKQGDDTKSIDYSTHKLNRDAADYAQRMVDRQQNISDMDLQGKLLGSRKTGTKLMTSVLMPFASFRLNQFMRATSDISTLTSKTTSFQDKVEAAQSLAGYTTEMVLFKGISFATAYAMTSAAISLMNREETQEEKDKRWDNLVRSQVSGGIGDMFSPLPVVDLAYTMSADQIMNAAQSLADVPDEQKFRLYTNYKKDLLRDLGQVGIAARKFYNLGELFYLAHSGEYEDEYGRTKYLLPQDQEDLKMFIPSQALVSAGVLPSDFNKATQDAIKFAKKGAFSGTKNLEDEMEKQERKEEKESDTEQKISTLRKMSENTVDKEKIKAIQDKISYLSRKSEGNEEYYKEKADEERKRKDKLLGEYDSESDMKRYDKDLYEKNFGPNSEWYQDHKYEKDIEKELNDELQKQQDIEMNYSKPKKNSDGTKKRKSKKDYSWRKYMYKKGD
jgi:hypothetical protein